LSAGAPATVHVPGGLYLQARFFAATRGLWRRLGNLETSVLADEIGGIAIDRPLYVTSLARAGTTIVTEMLERHPDVTSHRYSDFPNCWTPYWRNHLLRATRRETPALQERAHHDRIQVSNDSPEAVEEVLWMYFFPGAHDSRASVVLGNSTSNPAFEDFYRAHVRKLLAVRGCSRYLAKGNYNITRLAYLRRLFPDARFVIPLRDPVHHIASLAKQHALFTSASAEDPRVARLLALSGHFEFGPQRQYVHCGDDAAAQAIGACWADGREVEGWARYWASTYSLLARQLEDSPGLPDAVLLFRYEDLCEHAEAVIDALLAHCGLDAGAFAETRAEFSQRLSLPDYYRPGFSEAETELIGTLCGPVLDRLGAHCLQAV